MPGAEATALVGVWGLVDCLAVSASASWRPHGEAPVGRLVYSPGGRLVVVMGDRSRAPFAIPDPHAGTPEEYRAAMKTFAAYTGRWQIEAGRLVHTLELAWAPPWTNSTQLRQAHLTDPHHLRLSTAPTRVGGVDWVLHLDWVREE